MNEPTCKTCRDHGSFLDVDETTGDGAETWCSCPTGTMRRMATMGEDNRPGHTLANVEPDDGEAAPPLEEELVVVVLQAEADGDPERTEGLTPSLFVRRLKEKMKEYETLGWIVKPEGRPTVPVTRIDCSPPIPMRPGYVFDVDIGVRNRFVRRIRKGSP